MNVKHLIYCKLAEIMCFLCHGRCCHYMMVFTGTTINEKGDQKVVLKDVNKKERCVGYNNWTGRCDFYEERKLEICKQWKCRTLNWLSRLLGEPTWDGVLKNE